MKKAYLDSFLDDSEKELIKKFADNIPMMKAVEKVLLAGAYNSGVLRKGIPADPLENFALSIACIQNATNEEVGADVKACWQAMNSLANAFNNIKMYRTIEEPVGKKNPAR